MKKILRRVALTVTSLGLSVGWAGVAAADTNAISGTGAGSENVISCNVDETYTMDNNANVTANSFNGQLVGTGETEVRDNRNVGGVGGGSSMGSQASSTAVSLNQGGAGAWLGAGGSGAGGLGGGSSTNSSISNTGEGSENKIKYDVHTNVEVKNNANVTAKSTNLQAVYTGETEVKDNRNVGHVDGGSATGTQTSSTSVTVSQ